MYLYIQFVRISSLSFILGITLFLFSCGGSDSKVDRAEEKPGESAALPKEDFDVFYARFHSDSIYQMEHIHFPLKGLPPRVDSITLAQDNFYWPQSAWRMHRPLDPRDKDFRQEFNWLADDMVQEYIINLKSGYGLERRFAVIDGEWTLIYYAAMNQLSTGNGQ